MMEAGVARVCVSLERYFEDERARVLLTVTRGSVGDLAQRLRTCFGLPGAFCLTSRGMLLPPEEPHTLLRDGDRVEVVPLREAWPPWDKPTTTSVRDRSYCDTGGHELETRKKEALAMLSLAECGEVTHQKGSGTLSSQGEGGLLHLEEGAFLHQEGIPHRRKRVRKRLKKMPLEPGPEHTLPPDDDCVPRPAADCTPEPTPPVVNFHIRFPAESSTVQQNAVTVGPGRVVHALTESLPACL